MTTASPPARRSPLAGISRRLPVALVLSALCLTLVGTAAQAADPPPSGPAGSIGLRLVDAPVEARDDPRARVYIVDHLAPGEVINRRIEVSNGTTSAAKVALYPAAASIVDGAFLGASGRTANDLSSWTTVTPSSPEISPSGAVMATVTIAVPPDAAPGEQYGVVWVEASAPPAGGSGVTQVSRVGLRLYVDIGPGGAPAPDFSVDTLTAARDEAGGPAVHATVLNLGGRALDMTGTLQLSNGPGGISAGPFDAEAGLTLGVGDTGAVNIVLDDALPAGPWDAVVTLRSGRVEKTAQATITFPATGQAAPVGTTSTTTPGWLLPAGTGLAVLALTAGAAVVTRRLRSRRLGRDGGVPQRGLQPLDARSSRSAHTPRTGRAGAHRAPSRGRRA